MDPSLVNFGTAETTIGGKNSQVINILLVGIAHGGSTEIPNGDSTFERGDSVVVVVRQGTLVRQLNDIFE